MSVVVTRCGEHPAHPAAHCPECPSPADVAKVDHAARAAEVKAALRSSPRYVEPAVKAARAAERRGA